MKSTKIKTILLVILLLALILRLIAAHHTHVSTDEMIYSIIPLNIIGSGQLGTIEQSPLYFYLVDVGYKFTNGITAISTRLPSIILGSFSLLVIYLIARKLFNTNTALLAAFLFAISGYGIKYNYEMDMAAFFFSILAFYFFMIFLEKRQNSFLYLTAISFALAIMIKNIVLLFLPAFLLYLFLKKIKFNKKIIKSFSLAFVLVLLLLSPVFIYNYLTLQEKGITDYYFSNIAGIGETVHQGLQGKEWSFARLSSNSKVIFSRMLKIDFVIIIFAIFGSLYSLKHKKHEALFLLSSIFFLHLYISGQTASASHFLWLPLILSIFAAAGIIIVGKRLKKVISLKNITFLIMIAAVISSFFVMQDVVAGREQSITLQLRDYVHENIPEDAVVVIDPRIYRGIHAWVFNDKHYLGGGQFNQLMSNLEQIPDVRTEVPVYYIECGKGTNCGWKPEDFARVYDVGEAMSNNFKQSFENVATIDAHHKFHIHKGIIDLPQGIYEPIDRSHVFWFYPIGWHYPELAVDHYQVTGFKNLLHLLGMFILYIDLFLALLSILLVLKLAKIY
tara:strand:+ start:46556 stop:48238 length:1683 start_codon:yes stop_codon:yes gene_type:complete